MIDKTSIEEALKETGAEGWMNEKGGIENHQTDRNGVSKEVGSHGSNPEGKVKAPLFSWRFKTFFKLKYIEHLVRRELSQTILLSGDVSACRGSKGWVCNG